jgi:hypothetical protein
VVEDLLGLGGDSVGVRVARPTSLFDERRDTTAPTVGKIPEHFSSGHRITARRRKESHYRSSVLDER